MMKKRFLPSVFSGLLLAGSIALYMPPAQAQLFGESDEEKAARQKHEDGQDAQIAQLTQRIAALEESERSLEESLRQVTGNNETLGHRVEELTQKLERQQKDFAYRLCMLSAQQLDVDQDNGGLNCAAAAASSSAPSSGAESSGAEDSSSLTPLQGGDTFSAPADNMQSGLAPGPRVLGTLPAGAPLPSAPSADHRQYDAAMNLLAKAQYDQARTAFRAYADSHEGDDLAGEAVYWVGDIYYVQKDYPDAARAFAESIKKYPNSSRGPDSMLKLAQSLLAQGQTKGGCTALAAIKTKSPHAADSTLAAAAVARKASCR